MYSCHPYGPSSKHNLANDISAGTYAFSYTIAAQDDPDPDKPAKVSAWTKRVWGKIDEKSGEAIASGDDSKARTKGLYLGELPKVMNTHCIPDRRWLCFVGDANLQHRMGRCKSARKAATPAQFDFTQ